MSRTKHYMKSGERVPVIGPYSEVMCHMGLAGRPADIEFLECRFGDRTYHSAQVYRDSNMAGAPVTCGEAGIYFDEDGKPYCYRRDDNDQGDANPKEEERRMYQLIKDALGG